MVKVNHDIANDLGVDVELEELYQLSMWVSDIMVENLRFFNQRLLVDETLVLVYLDGQNDIACMLEKRLYIPCARKVKYMDVMNALGSSRNYDLYQNF
jgi:hypothetical protein